MIISRSQLFAMKALKNRLLQSTIASLERRFLGKEIEILKNISSLLSPACEKISVIDIIDKLASEYPFSISKTSLEREMVLLQGVKKTFRDRNLVDFCGILVGSYQDQLPQCSILAEFYLLAPIQNAVVERGFNKQNQIITPNKARVLIKTVGKKVLLKYISVLFDDDEIEKILDQAAVMWTSSERRAGQGT